jgi:hypothetical protein
MRNSSAKPIASRRAATGPLPRVPDSALRGPKTLEDRLLPGLFVAAFVGLLAIQVVHALAG